MQELLSQLRDIRGLDRVHIWPLAPGWWVVIGAVAVLAAIAAFLWWRNTKQLRGWRLLMVQRLDALRSDNGMSIKDKAAALSEWLRIAAIKKYGRDACAGLSGKAWLSWLSDKDPYGFNWGKAVILTEAPFAPGDKVRQPENWDALLDAAERWVR